MKNTASLNMFKQNIKMPIQTVCPCKEVGFILVVLIILLLLLCFYHNIFGMIFTYSVNLYFTFLWILSSHVAIVLLTGNKFFITTIYYYYIVIHITYETRNLNALLEYPIKIDFEPTHLCKEHSNTNITALRKQQENNKLVVSNYNMSLQIWPSLL